MAAPGADNKVRRVFGFPEFWPVVDAKYPRFFEVAPKTLTAMHSIADRAYPALEPHQRAILNLSMVAGITFVEIVTLTVNGLGRGAMRTLRSLLEISINTEYLRLRPGEFEDYKEWYWVERFKEQEYLRLNANLIFQQLGPEVVKEVEENMARVRPRFERTKRDGTKELRGSWCSRNLADRSAVAGHTDAYRLINSMASSFVHETMYGMVRYFDAAKDIHRVEVPPTLDWSPQTLSGAHHCMVQVVKTLGKAFDTASTPPLEELEKDWHYAWPQPDGLA
jgi:hypothetical protein